MSVKELKKPVQKLVLEDTEKKAQQFIAQGGSLAEICDEKGKDHRLTLRIPQWLMEKVDVQRKKRVGSISRNLWILEVIEQATQK